MLLIRVCPVLDSWNTHIDCAIDSVLLTTAQALNAEAGNVLVLLRGRSTFLAFGPFAALLGRVLNRQPDADLVRSLYGWVGGGLAALGVILSVAAATGVHDGCALADMSADNPTPIVAAVALLVTCGLGGIALSVAHTLWMGGTVDDALVSGSVSAAVLVVAAVPAFELYVVVEVADLNDAVAEAGGAVVVQPCKVDGQSTFLCVRLGRPTV